MTRKREIQCEYFNCEKTHNFTIISKMGSKYRHIFS